jgi:hypothetical protein
MDPVAERDQVLVALWQEKQDRVVDLSRCGVVAHNQSLHAGFAAVHHKIVRLLGSATKPRREARWVETGSRRFEKFRCRGKRSGIAGFASGGRGLRRRCGRTMRNAKSSSYRP